MSVGEDRVAGGEKGPIDGGHPPTVFSFHTFIYALWVVLLEVGMCFDAGAHLETEEESVPSIRRTRWTHAHSLCRST